ncbi:MAG: FAD-dependent oxidoreductase [Alphaproteobacteria bacterium]|nr:MAG: FAD-dependent oxidoreductase [Alphaproteobacteria bacterium]
MPAARRTFPFVTPPEVETGRTAEVPITIVGAGPVGLSAALDLAARGQRVLLLDRDDVVSDGSRAICIAKRTLEISDRLGIGERLLEKGVKWNVGRVFFRDQEVYHFNLLPVDAQKFPAFVNIQQYYWEEYLIDRIADEPLIDLRWKNEVTGVEQDENGVTLSVETPAGGYRVRAEWVIAADGAHSPMRAMLGLDFQGRIFEDHFLIADVRFKHEHPDERWFWFDPPFNPGQSALMHKQPDDVWRLDFQLGWNIDREEAVKPENVTPLVRGMLGPDVEFEYEWISIYTFQCRRLERFLHDRVIFAGDAAHLVSPFGARGANSGVQDIDNLGWKLDLVMRGAAPRDLLESYDHERVQAADENILNSTRATDFITPKTPVSRAWRDAVLELARTHEAIRPFINSGRLSTPKIYEDSPIETPDAPGEFTPDMKPGSPALDAPVRLADGSDGWLLEQLGERFQALVFVSGTAMAEGMAKALAATGEEKAAIEPLFVLPAGISPSGLEAHAVVDRDGLVAERYQGRAGTVYLLRPDQHVAARMRHFEPAALRRARDRAMGRG